MRGNDYSLLPMGRTVGNGWIARCSVCGLRGLSERIGLRVFCTHSRSIGLDEIGKPILDWYRHVQDIPTI